MPQPVADDVQRHAAFEPAAPGFAAEVVKVQVDVVQLRAWHFVESAVAPNFGAKSCDFSTAVFPPADPRRNALADLVAEHKAVAAERLARGSKRRISSTARSREEIGTRRAVRVFVCCHGRRISARVLPMNVTVPSSAV